MASDEDGSGAEDNNVSSLEKLANRKGESSSSSSSTKKASSPHSTSQKQHLKRKRRIVFIESPNVHDEPASSSSFSRSSGKKAVAVASSPPHQHQQPSVDLTEPNDEVDVHETFYENEDALNNFTKMHPMLSMNATSASVMGIVSEMIRNTNIHVKAPPMVPKSHDDLFLEPANEDIGERPCIMKEKCIAMEIANIRYGPKNNMGFVCKEFLLPDQLHAVRSGKQRPKIQQKCLLCTRYMMSYVYILARSDPNFAIPNGVSFNLFQNPVYTDSVCSAPSSRVVDEKDVIHVIKNGPSHSSPVSCDDGYRPSCMLFVDSEFYNKRSSRETKLSEFAVNNCVRFCSTHYKYNLDPDTGKPYIVQVGVGCEDRTDGLGFPSPSSRRASARAAEPTNGPNGCRQPHPLPPPRKRSN